MLMASRFPIGSLYFWYSVERSAKMMWTEQLVWALVFFCTWDPLPFMKRDDSPHVKGGGGGHYTVGPLAVPLILPQPNAVLTAVGVITPSLGLPASLKASQKVTLSSNMTLNFQYGLPCCCRASLKENVVTR